MSEYVSVSISTQTHTYKCTQLDETRCDATLWWRKSCRYAAAGRVYAVGQFVRNFTLFLHTSILDERVALFTLETRQKVCTTLNIVLIGGWNIHICLLQLFSRLLNKLITNGETQWSNVARRVSEITEILAANCR